jgi:hypothetical protein
VDREVKKGLSDEERSRVDFAQLVKNYSNTQKTTRYSPAKTIGAEKKPQFGRPDWNCICTSDIERLNLTLRMNLRRFTRLTNAHSKSHKHHVAIKILEFPHWPFYNPVGSNSAWNAKQAAIHLGSATEFTHELSSVWFLSKHGDTPSIR